MTPALDAVTFGLLSAALVSVCEEMGAALRRSSYSPIIREMLDYSCAIFDERGRLVAQGEFIPAQLGAMALVVQAVAGRHHGDLRPGDVFIANHPYLGGAHTPDVNLVRPVFEPEVRRQDGRRLLGWVGTVAHQVDFGGPNPGTEGADHRSLFAEGLVLPPIRFETTAGPVAELGALIAANVRDPISTMADLRAQAAACRVGERRVLELAEWFGTPMLRAGFDRLIEYADLRTRAVLAALPDGEAEAEGYLDDDGAGGPPTRLHVRLVKRGNELIVDLSGASRQVAGGVNNPWASTRACIAYLVRAVTDPTIPANEGMLGPVTIVCPEGSVLRPHPPAAVSVRHLTCQRLADTLVRAASRLWPELPVAGHFVGFFSIMAEGMSPRTGRPAVMQDVVGGGTGAHGPRRRADGKIAPPGDGLDGVDTHLSNVGLLSAEVLELEYPWRLLCSELIRGSEGRGRFRGGRGLRRVYEVLAAPQPVVLYCEQTDPRFRPWGAAGGKDGMSTRIIVRDPRRSAYADTVEGNDHPATRLDRHDRDRRRRRLGTPAPLDSPAVARPFRLYICSDIHASERTWRKLLNATAANVYHADAVLVAGDMTGKALIAVVRGEQSGGEVWSASVLGQRRVARDETELLALERSIADLGYYAVRVTPDEREAMERDPEVVKARFREVITHRLRDWLTLAAERLAGSEVPVYVMPGNDDDFEIDHVLTESTYCRNVNEQVVDLTPWHQLVSMGWSSPTPWNTPRELPEEEFLDRLSGLMGGVRDPRRTIVMTHVPPYDSGLDTAPLLSPDLRPTVSAGDVLRGPVGSHGVRAAIESFRPVLGVHGHIHESGGERRIGDTLCVNAGSESSMGILRGYLIDLGPNGIERSMRVEG